MTTTATVHKTPKGLLNLPNELVLYIFRNFLDLGDLWCLFQTSSELRFFASTVIGTTWKIETRRQQTPDIIMKVQCRTALISLQILASQLSFHQQDQLPIIRKSFLIEPTLVSNTSTAIVNFLTVGSNIITAAAVSNNNSNEEVEQQEVVVVEDEGIVVRNTELCDDHAAAASGDADDEEREQDDDEQQKTSNSTLLHLTNNNKSTTTNKKTTTMNEKIRLFKDLIAREERLHHKIIKGIASYKHKYVLIEDIDIRNRIRTAVDVVFHHAVFVSAISRCTTTTTTTTTTHVRHGSTTVSTKNRALAAVLVRLLTKLDIAFPSYCREITYTLADNIKAFLEYTGYKILAASSTSSLNLTLHSISACFDLMGAAFVGKILSDSHVDCAVQRTCELLSSNNPMLNSFKRSLLMDLLDHWLTIKREVGSGELCRYIRLEIEKCDRQQATAVVDNNNLGIS